MSEELALTGSLRLPHARLQCHLLASKNEHAKVKFILKMRNKLLKMPLPEVQCKMTVENYETF